MTLRGGGQSDVDAMLRGAPSKNTEMTRWWLDKKPKLLEITF
jgi:hypothetical protein